MSKRQNGLQSIFESYNSDGDESDVEGPKSTSKKPRTSSESSLQKPQRKIVFLDVDAGVLHPLLSPKSFSEWCLRPLAVLLTEIPAEIVLSSTWRFYEHFIKRLNAVLASYGIGKIRLTTGPKGASRSGEILKWLGTNTSEAQTTLWVALDDLDLCKQSDQFKKSFCADRLLCWTDGGRCCRGYRLVQRSSSRRRHMMVCAHAATENSRRRVRRRISTLVSADSTKEVGFTQLSVSNSHAPSDAGLRTQCHLRPRCSCLTSIESAIASRCAARSTSQPGPAPRRHCPKCK